MDEDQKRKLVAETLERYQKVLAQSSNAGAEDNDFHPLIAQIESILESMPKEETRSYFEAKRKVPHLVSIESDPVKYLRYFKMDPQASANRIAKYWDLRQKTFGERAFRPMTSTSDGALDEQALDFMRVGQICFLPNDTQGRIVICSDSTRRLEHNPAVRMKLFFYIGQVLAEKEASRTHGVRVLHILAGHPKFDIHTQCVKAYMDVLPVTFLEHHMLDLTPETNAVSKFEQTHANLVRLFPTPIHRYKRKRDYVSALVACGFKREGIPRIVGGLWSYRQFVKWQNDRIRIERQRYPDPASFLDDAGKIVYYMDSNDEGNDETDESEGEEKDFLGNYRRFLEEAINQIPDIEKEAYLEAMQQAPDEIKKNEANIDWFLLAEELNCWSAANRIVRYWKLRSETFQDSRYLALNQTGEGALNGKDLHKTLSTGFLMLLPNDEQGCPVLWINFSRLDDEIVFDAASTKRCLFYMFSLLAENEESQKDGASLLLMLQKRSPFMHIDTNFLQRLSESIPVNIKAVHLFSHDDCGELFNAELASQIHFGDEVYVHTYSASTKHGLLVKLEQAGLKRSGLPKELGGEWDLAKFCQWTELRTRFEWKLPIGLSGRHDQADAFLFPAVTPYRVLSETDKAERKRRMNVIHSRRKRDRVKIEVEVLREQILQLREEQIAMAQENRRLESLLRSALSYLQNQRFSV